MYMPRIRQTLTNKKNNMAWSIKHYLLAIFFVSYVYVELLIIVGAKQLIKL